MEKSATIEKIEDLVKKDPSFVKGLSDTEVSSLCAQLRKEILEATSAHGGHLSSNLGDVELTVALHRAFDFPTDKLIFDVGHQCYAHKILSGRDLSSLYTSGGVAGFQKRKESPYDPYEAGHSSTALSAAEAFADARDKKGEHYHIVALVGDASIVNGLSFEALNSIGGKQTKVIVILNDNEMSISLPVGGASRFFRRVASGATYQKLKKGFRRILYPGKVGRKIYDSLYNAKNFFKRLIVPLNLFDNLGFSYVGPVNGHDVKAMEKAFNKAKNSVKPVIVHVRTVKGKGYRYAENDKNGNWHGVPPFDIETGKPKTSHPGQISWSQYYASLIETSLAECQNRMLITPATLKGAGLEKVFSLYPNQCTDFGIAEEHALTYAGAISMQGIHPIVSIYSTFLQRAYDELSHDCARMDLNLTLLIERSGLCGYYGETHQGIYDETYLKSIPNVIITMPSNKGEAHYLFEESLKEHGVFAIRFPNSTCPETEGDEIPNDIQFGKWRHIKASSSKKVALISVGPKCREIESLLKQKELDVELISPLFLYPLNDDTILPLLSFATIFIHDAYATKSGFAESLLAKLMEVGYQGKVIVRAIPDVFVSMDSKENQEKSFGLTSPQIIEEVEKLLSSGN